jgi:hypothetical protein
LVSNNLKATTRAGMWQQPYARFRASLVFTSDPGQSPSLPAIPSKPHGYLLFQGRRGSLLQLLKHSSLTRGSQASFIVMMHPYPAFRWNFAVLRAKSDT